MSIYRFLAVNDPIGEGILVVDAWIPERTLAESANIFRSERYRYLIVVGSTLPERRGMFNGPPANVDLAAGRLERLGVDPTKLVRISVRDDPAGRTLGRATAVRQWLDTSGIAACCVDVLTVGVHARKNWIVFQHALGSNYRVGIIAGPEVRYNPKFWFVSRTGIWLVMRNLVGYFHSKLGIFFDRKGVQSPSRGDFRSSGEPEDSAISRQPTRQASERC